MKAQVTMVEMITTVVLLFIVFGILFPSFSYKSKWDEALMLVKGRDLVLTMDRLGNLYNYSFDSEALKNFLSQAITEKTIIAWSETQGTIKSKITVACNCTDEEISALTSWFDTIKLNNRSIKIYFLKSTLDKIYGAEGDLKSDLLLIWGYKDLTDYRQQLENYLAKGNGIVEIMDFDQQADDVQKKIFGIDTGGDWADVDYDVVLKPSSVDNITYQPYKLFYHVPIPLKAESEGLLIGCTEKNATGNFTLWNTNYTFSICDGKSVYFDTDGDNTIDTGPLTERSKFTLQKITNPTGSYDFFLNYVDYERIDISFRPMYNFTDFCRAPPVKKRVVPLNDEFDRVFVHAIKVLGWGEDVRGYCSILNGTIAGTAWVADFSRDGLDKVGDDHKELLLSLLLFASNKRRAERVYGNIRIGYMTSYVNTVNQDMFEVYRFNLGLGYPF